MVNVKLVFGIFVFFYVVGIVVGVAWRFVRSLVVVVIFRKFELFFN